MLKPLTLAVAAILMASPALATTCKTNTYDGGFTNTIVAKGVPGNRLDHPWECPVKSATENCPNGSLSEQSPSTLFVTDNPDILKHQDLDAIKSLIESIKAGKPVQVWKAEQAGACS